MPIDHQPLSTARKPREKRRPRIKPLSVLPVFFNLTERPVLLAGGSQDALWKADLIKAAGASLTVVADDFCEEFVDFLHANSQVKAVDRCWQPSDFDGAAIAIGAFDCTAVAACFADIAHHKGVVVNTVDKPKSCDFQFGSIVNRSPAVVAISTDGAAPILGQAIRRRIETLLPETLQAFAEKAKSIRSRVAAEFTDRTARLQFWRDFSEAAFQKADPEATLETLFGDKESVPQQKGGHVSLVGAGPGAADLLTLRAVQTLQSADVILFDDLVSTEVLELARREARRFTVGKRGGRDSCRQEDITNMMIKFAQKGQHVVRLKSGDPMVFGRAGEEIEKLEALGIAVSVVPGITAAVAAASSTKTSLTHRDQAQGVKFITAHSKKGCLPDLDWRASADPATSLMIYMGASTAPALASKLLDHGLLAQTPVMIAKAVSRPEEDIQYVTLKDLQSLEINREQPVLIGIGMVFQAAYAKSHAPMIDAEFGSKLSTLAAL